MTSPCNCGADDCPRCHPGGGTWVYARGRAGVYICRAYFDSDEEYQAEIEAAQESGEDCNERF